MGRTRGRSPPLSLLEEAGFELGDFIPLLTFGPNAQREIVFTATTYSFNNSVSQVDIQWDEMLPDGVNIWIKGSGYFISGSGETADFQLYNVTDGEVIVEKTGVVNTGIVILGPVDYDPTTTADVIDLKWRWRESPGTNSSTLRTPYIILGTKI